PAFLIALVFAAPDPDLAARFQLAAVPGVSFRLVEGSPRPPARVVPARPLGDINWESMPEAITALAAPPEELAKARVLLATERGDPLLLAHPGEVLITMDTRGAVRRWPYFNYLLHAAAEVAAGRTPPRFGDWSGSPLPGPRTRRLIAIGGAALWLLTVFA